jgi:hypothetical protein
MDMTQYAGRGFIGVDDVANGPIRGVIAAVELGSFNKPVITLTNGPRFSLNVTNTQTLIAAFGASSDDWIGETIEFYAGTVRFKGEDQASVLVRPVARRAGEKKRAVPKPKNGDLDDEIPY